MEFTNRLKGQITQVLLKALLEDSGYRIVPLGIEGVIRELAILNESQYFALRLPNLLRRLPDFFVSDQSLSSASLIEVKYRKEWTNQTRELLGQQILPQVRDWSPIVLMVFLGTPAKADANLPSSWMGLIRLSCIEGEIHAIDNRGKSYAKWSEISWKDFKRVQDFFPALKDSDCWSKQTLQTVRSFLAQLNALDIFE